MTKQGVCIVFRFLLTTRVLVFKHRFYVWFLAPPPRPSEIKVVYVNDGQPHVLGGRESVQQQQRRRSAAQCPAAGITEPVAPALRVPDHHPQPAAPVPEGEFHRSFTEPFRTPDPGLDPLEDP